MTETMPATSDVVIVGAGIGGLTAALALHANGITATVLEAAHEIRPLGVGINIQPAAIGELTALGVGEELAARGIATREHRYLDHTGTTLWSEPRGVAAGHRHPQYSIHRGELQMLLLAAVADRLGPHAVRTGIRLHTLEHIRGGVRAHLRDRASGTSSTLWAPVLIGADGLHSAVRADLHPGQGLLHPAGVHMWRGLTALDSFLDGHSMIIANDTHANRLVAYPISARHRSAGRALLNWVCLVPTTDSHSEDADWNRPGRLADVLPHYAHWDLGCLDVPDMLARSEEILRYPMVDREPLTRWTRGRATLLGDAAHLMYPIGANGASQAILDAATLADELAHRSDVTLALDRYETIRRPATTAITHATREMDRAERAAATHPLPAKTAAFRALTSTYHRTVSGGRARP